MLGLSILFVNGCTEAITSQAKAWTIAGKHPLGLATELKDFKCTCWLLLIDLGAQAHPLCKLLSSCVDAHEQAKLPVSITTIQH